MDKKELKKITTEIYEEFIPLNALRKGGLF